MAVNAQITLCKYHCNIDFVKLYKKLVDLITWFEKIGEFPFTLEDGQCF